MAFVLPRRLLKCGQLPANSLYSISNFSALSSAQRPSPKQCKPSGIYQLNLTSIDYILADRAPRHWNGLTSGCRFASNRSLPTVMEFPNIVWPSVLKTIKNWVMINFIIKPYFDKEFDMSDFVGGTKHALEVRFLGNGFVECRVISIIFS